MNKNLRNPILFLALITMIMVACQSNKDKTKVTESIISKTKKPTSNTQEEEVKAIVEKLLFAAGNYNIEGLDEMISDKANFGIAIYRDEVWKNSVITIGEYFEDVKHRKLEPYYEPVNDYIIHINEGQIAFVWADATLYKYGVAKTNNIDNFTLFKEDGE